MATVSEEMSLNLLELYLKDISPQITSLSFINLIAMCHALTKRTGRCTAVQV